MEKERKIAAPEGCEIEKVELVDGVAVVTFREKERKLPKTWDEFCDMAPIYAGECYIQPNSEIEERDENVSNRWLEGDRNLLPDRATAEAVLALCQLIQLRDCYNGDWVPDWEDFSQDKFAIDFCDNEIGCDTIVRVPEILHFKTEELRDEFLENFGDLIEKLKPLYGIKEGGEE